MKQRQIITGEARASNLSSTLVKFLDAIIPSLNGDFIETRLISSRGNVQRHFHKTKQSLGEATTTILATHPNLNAYFGVCPRKREGGTKSAIRRVSSLWADLDAKDFPGGKREALKRLNEFPVGATAIIDSGHGYHPYWALKEPEEINNDDDIARIERYLRGLASALGGDPHAAEIARVLRVPGTLNVKNPDAPEPVTIVHLDTDRRYNLSDFDSLPTVKPMSEAVNEVRNKPGWIAEALGALREGNRNGTFTKITGFMHRQGLLRQDIFALLTPHAEQHGFPIKELDRLIEGICLRYAQKTLFPSSHYIGEETETDSKTLTPMSLAAFLDRDIAPIEWIVEGIFPKEATAIIAAPGGYGKSWMLLDLAIEITRGGHWLGHFPTTKGSVLYVDEESNENMLQNRLSKLLAAKELSCEQTGLQFIIGQGASIGNPRSVQPLREIVEQMRPDVIIMDSLIRMHGVEENSASEMSRVFKIVKGIVRDFQCLVVFADHQRKPGPFAGSLSFALRGTSEKVAFVDTLVSLRKTRGHLIVEHSKSRFAEPVASFLLEIEDIAPDATQVVYAGDAEQANQEARQEAAREFLETELPPDEWVPRKVLADKAKEAKISAKILDQTLKDLVVEGWAERDDRKTDTGRGGKAAYYRRKPTADPSLFLVPETEIEARSEQEQQDES